MAVQHFRTILVFFLLLLLTWWCYSPGLASLFLYDDFPNLQSLANVAQEPVFSASFWQFVTSGGAGPLGRPLSLFTFALQATDWPANPFAFKLVNCVLHLFNGTLVYLVCRQLARPLQLADSAIPLFCVSVTALWVLHPMHVSTVLFSVQRMTMLASTFLLLGTLFHLQLRLTTHAQTDRQQVLWLSCSLAATGILGLLSKEMAAVLLCYLLTLEYTLLAAQPVSRLLRIWRYLFLWLPLALLPIIAISQLGSLQQSYAERLDYTMSQKLLTEARILWMYLMALVTPSTANMSLFQLPAVSTSLWQPLTTLLATAAWLGLLAFACMKRLRFPVLAFAVFWYLGGHLIESTLLPLNLMFNHRNYLPYFGPLLAVGYGLSQLVWHGQPVASKIKWALCLLLGSLLAIQLQQQSRLWSQPLELASNWYLANPQDNRNIEFLAVQLAEQGEQSAPATARLFEQLVEKNPGSDRYLLSRLLLSCKFRSVPPPDDSFIAKSLQFHARPDNDVVNPLQQLVSLATNNTCPGVDPALLDRIAEHMSEGADPAIRGRIAFQRGRLAAAREDTLAMMNWFQIAFDLTQDPGVLFIQAQYLLAQNDKVAALQLIDKAEQLLFEYNDISTGTRASKQAALASLRAYANQGSEESTR